MTHPAFDAVVLAGGASRRMGRDKATLVLDGRRLVDRLADDLASVAGRVRVACGGRSLGRDDEVADAADCTGPLAGVLAGLRSTDGPHVAVVPVDAPATSPELVVRLVSMCARSRRAAVVATADGHVQALHAVIARTAVPAIEARAATGAWSPRALLAWLDALRVDVDGWGDLDPTGAFARDWDRPEDLPGELRTRGRPASS